MPGNPLRAAASLTHGGAGHQRESGEAALAAPSGRAQRGEPYRLLLLDSAMPGLSGFDVAAALQRGDIANW